MYSYVYVLDLVLIVTKNVLAVLVNNVVMRIKQVETLFIPPVLSYLISYAVLPYPLLSYPILSYVILSSFVFHPIYLCYFRVIMNNTSDHPTGCSLLGVLSTVVAIFYLAGWQLGAVEAISLSILVGTSVDYCVHLIEGYILAGNALPNLPSNKVSCSLAFLPLDKSLDVPEIMLFNLLVSIWL